MWQTGNGNGKRKKCSASSALSALPLQSTEMGIRKFSSAVQRKKPTFNTRICREAFEKPTERECVLNFERVERRRSRCHDISILDAFRSAAPYLNFSAHSCPTNSHFAHFSQMRRRRRQTKQTRHTQHSIGVGCDTYSNNHRVVLWEMLSSLFM